MYNLCTVQMEQWESSIVYINKSCLKLGPKCLQVLGMHCISGYDTVSYPFGKGKVSALNTLLSEIFPGLSDKLGEIDATPADLLETEQTVLLLCMDSPQDLQ